MAPVIVANNLGVRYAGNQDWTLQDVSLEVQSREFVSLVGGSGVGKSTLLRVIAGLLPAASGQMAMPLQKIAGQRRRSLVFQDGRLLPWRTVRDNVALGLEGLALSTGEMADRVDEMLALTRMQAFADRWPHQLSGGQAQRVGIARALAVRPTVLLMDEPFSAVDALTRRTLQDELSSIWHATDAAVVFVTHDIEEAVLLSDRVLVLGGSPAGIVSETAITLPRPRNRRDPTLLDGAGRIIDSLEH